MPGNTMHDLRESLSERELEILRLLSDGLSNGEVAQKLFLSPETVRWYNKQLYSKLGAHNRTDAVARARDYGLLDTKPNAAGAVIREAPPHALPAQLTSFVGREREIGEIRRLLE